jgi:hypothetical protein
MSVDPAKRAKELSNRIRPILAGEHPFVQGAVLADLLALWLAGHDPGLREEIFEMHLDYVRKLIAANLGSAK